MSKSNIEKVADLNKAFDVYRDMVSLAKGRLRAGETPAYKLRQQAKASGSDGEEVVDVTKVQTMSNPGPTEKEHYERTKGGSVSNLKKLAESKDPHDRKAAERGLARHKED
jgi:hypothetical protein